MPEWDKAEAVADARIMLCSSRALGTRGKLEYSPWAILDTQLPAVSPTMSTHGTAELQSHQGALLHSSPAWPEPVAVTGKCQRDHAHHQCRDERVQSASAGGVLPSGALRRSGVLSPPFRHDWSLFRAAPRLQHPQRRQ